MVKTPRGYLRRPAVRGFMAPQVVLELLTAVEAQIGPDARRDLLDAAQTGRLPALDEPVREDKAARLHQTLRRLYPEAATTVLRLTGEATADALLANQQSTRAQAMLSGAPWTIAAWLLGRWARQHDWTFVGTGTFSVLNALEYQIDDNPLLRGDFPATGPVCPFHVALFQRFFRRLVNADLLCQEVVPEGPAPVSCRFVIALA